MTWDEIHSRWMESCIARRHAEAFQRLSEARKRVAENDDADWAWLEKALADNNRKWFVAQVFRYQPVPKRLFGAMMLASIVDVNPSSSRWYLDPCVESFGKDRVVQELNRLKSLGCFPEVRFTWAEFWLRREPERIRGIPKA